MSDLQGIARSKVEAELNSRLLALPAEVQALQRQLSAKGQLMSGNMLRGVLRLGQESLQAQGNAITTHYAWAVREALTASQSWVQALAAEGADSLAPLVTKASDLVKDACQLAKQPALSARLLADLDSTHLRVRESIITSMDAEFAVKRRGLLRWLGSLFGRLLRLGATGP